MAFTAGDVILEFRDQHSAFSEELTPDTVALRHLARYTREIHARLVEKDSSLYAERLQTAMPLADFEAGITLPDAVQILGGTIVYESAYTEPLNLVPWRARQTPNLYSCAYRLGGALYLCGDETAWTDVTRIDVYYVAEPALPADYADTVPLPDAAKAACIYNLAAWTARRISEPGATAPDVRGLEQKYREAEHELMVEVAQHSRSESVYVREEW
jgi:hypothetical protein